MPLTARWQDGNNLHVSEPRGHGCPPLRGTLQARVRGSRSAICLKEQPGQVTSHPVGLFPRRSEKVAGAGVE